MRNVLITGGLGYVGGRVASYLRQTGEYGSIWITTRDSARMLPSWSKEFGVLELDILDQQSIARCFSDIDVDIIVHLAAMNEIESLKSPDEALAVNTVGTYNLLDWARKNHLHGFIYFSTFHVYGETSNSIITENTLTRPSHPYAITHRAAEDFVRFGNRYYGLRSLVLRLSNAYGYPMHKEVNRWTLVFNDLCRQAVVNGRIVLQSSGKQHRDFIALHDVARAVHHFISRGPESWGDETYNLGGNCSMSILDVARKIADVYDDQYGDRRIEIEVGEECKNARWHTPIQYNIDKVACSGF